MTEITAQHAESLPMETRTKKYCSEGQTLRYPHITGERKQSHGSTLSQVKYMFWVSRKHANESQGINHHLRLVSTKNKGVQV